MKTPKSMPKTAIYCATEDEKRELLQILETNPEARWASGCKPTEWFPTKSCVFIEDIKSLVQETKEEAESDGDTILTLPQYKEALGMNKWKEGDVIVNETQKRVIDMIIGGKWLIAPNIDEKGNHSGVVGYLYTQERFEVNGWTKEEQKPAVVEPSKEALLLEALEIAHLHITSPMATQLTTAQISEKLAAAIAKAKGETP